jgi:CheY-like chemotaxis protein
MDCSIVLGDIKMPGITGLELAMRLKDNRTMKIILMTAFSIGRVLEIIPSTPIEGFVIEPFRSVELIEARVVDGSKQK